VLRKRAYINVGAALDPGDRALIGLQEFRDLACVIERDFRNSSRLTACLAGCLPFIGQSWSISLNLRVVMRES
jgi:hypothetical protein